MYLTLKDLDGFGKLRPGTTANSIDLPCRKGPKQEAQISVYNNLPESYLRLRNVKSDAANLTVKKGVMLESILV